jgi:hypothetical protein
MRKLGHPSTLLATLGLMVSVGFSSLPSAVAAGASDAAGALGLADASAKRVVNLTVRKAKVADKARRLGRYKPIAPSSKAIGTAKARKRVLVLSSKGKVPARALQAAVAGPQGPAGPSGAPGRNRAGRAAGGVRARRPTWSDLRSDRPDGDDPWVGRALA